MNITLLEGQYLQRQVREELIFISYVFFNILLWNSKLFKLLVKILLAEIFETVN